ncbi:MAG: hypothetical protein HKP58_01180 [Desulfatitalea sp.]|nr:hypothetical protein [Desulfatitalea sp.]NNJ98999.1 hypothetical protein [Desulfatitalea sp.]
MNLSKKITLLAVAWLLVVAVSVQADQDQDMPKERIVQIRNPVTKLVVNILPGRGVKVIFPWVLDENSVELPYTGLLTNDSAFELFWQAGQNFIVYKIKKADTESEGTLGDAFVNVAGFHFNLTLRVSFSRSAHYSTVIFELCDADKLELVERAVQRRQTALVEEYKLKESELDRRAEKMALKLVGRMATSGRDTSNIKEEQKLKLSNGDRVIFYADKIITYGNIHVIPIEATNDSAIEPLYIDNISLEKMNGEQSYPLLSEFEMPLKVKENETVKGFVVTNDASILNSQDAKMTLISNKGKVELQW